MSAAQIDDGAHAARRKRAQMARRRLGRPPDPIRDLMEVGVGLADHPVVDQPQIEVVDGRAEAARHPRRQAGPGGDLPLADAAAQASPLCFGQLHHLVSDSEVRHTSRLMSRANFGIRRTTRIISLLVCIQIEKFAGYGAARCGEFLDSSHE